MRNDPRRAVRIRAVAPSRLPNRGTNHNRGDTMKRTLVSSCLLAAAFAAADAAELHVAVTGDDAAPGTAAAPLRTIQRAAGLAQPGDTVTVHAGTYRERVNPARGGESDARRIIYQAAPGEEVVIKGSEVVKGWEREEGDLWRVTLPASFFGGFNPFADEIRGDWFAPLGRKHHTGAVYLNGDWLTEAAAADELRLPDGQLPAWMTGGGTDGHLLNVAWIEAAKRVPAARFAAVDGGIQAAPCGEGGECIGWIKDGNWARYEAVEFGAETRELRIRAAAPGFGGRIEVRLDAADGELLGTCVVKPTGDWQHWETFPVAIKPTGGTRNLCLVFRRPPAAADAVAAALRHRSLNPNLWFAEVDAAGVTTLRARFAGADPNRELVEVNVRRTVFYPDQPGRDFITVRGFRLRHAATPWAPPTAGQVGLLGTHWSKGWIIEDNTISHSTCTGITLGKHGDKHDNTSADTAEGYVETIKRAHAFPIPWTREHIGHHVVRNNTISHCEQAGIVGSLGAAFSTITGNTIHEIHVRRLFSGAEMAGIKLHAAIDTPISCNHVFRSCQGLWLDWMAQGTRVTANLFHDNLDRDLFVEVNHGPFVVDNNLFLSASSLLDMSEGGAYAHNLFGGTLVPGPEMNRETPWHPAHSTAVAGLARIPGGDNRFFNNLFIGPGAGAAPRGPGGHGLQPYDGSAFPQFTGGNVHCHGARPLAGEKDALVLADHDPQPALVPRDGGLELRLDVAGHLAAATTAPVTSVRLGKARVPGLPYVRPDDSPLVIDADFLGKPRDPARPTPGPFENPGTGVVHIRVR